MIFQPVCIRGIFEPHAKFDMVYLYFARVECLLTDCTYWSVSGEGFFPNVHSPLSALVADPDSVVCEEAFTFDPVRHCSRASEIGRDKARDGLDPTRPHLLCQETLSCAAPVQRSLPPRRASSMPTPCLGPWEGPTFCSRFLKNDGTTAYKR
jgi:hypothetical protein